MRRIRKRRSFFVSSPPLAGVNGKFLDACRIHKLCHKKMEIRPFFCDSKTLRSFDERIVGIDMNYMFCFFGTWILMRTPLPFLGFPCCYMKRRKLQLSRCPVLRKTIRRRKISNQRTCRCRVYKPEIWETYKTLFGMLGRLGWNNCI